MKKSLFITITAFLLYLFQSLIRGIIIGTFHVNESVAEICSILIVLAIVFLMIGKRESLSYYGVCMWEGEHFLQTNFFLFLVPLVNLPYLFSGAKINIVLALISSVFISIMEELIFRSFLCRSIEQISNQNKAIIFSSVLFGCLHLLNIGKYPLVFILLQVTYAFAMGIAFSVVFYEYKSILPCILVHIAVDLLGAFEAEPILIADIIGTVVCSFCALYFYCFVRKRRKSET